MTLSDRCRYWFTFGLCLAWLPPAGMARILVLDPDAGRLTVSLNGGPSILLGCRIEPTWSWRAVFTTLDVLADQMARELRRRRGEKSAEPELVWD